MWPHFFFLWIIICNQDIYLRNTEKTFLNDPNLWSQNISKITKYKISHRNKFKNNYIYYKIHTQTVTIMMR